VPLALNNKAPWPFEKTLPNDVFCCCSNHLLTCYKHLTYIRGLNLFIHLIFTGGIVMEKSMLFWYTQKVIVTMCMNSDSTKFDNVSGTSLLKKMQLKRPHLGCVKVKNP